MDYCRRPLTLMNSSAGILFSCNTCIQLKLLIQVYNTLYYFKHISPLGMLLLKPLLFFANHCYLSYQFLSIHSPQLSTSPSLTPRSRSILKYVEGVYSRKKSTWFVTSVEIPCYNKTGRIYLYFLVLPLSHEAFSLQTTFSDYSYLPVSLLLKLKALT